MPQEEKYRLDSWKDISEYLRKDVSTLIRWRKERGLPVYGIPGGKRQGVFAYRDEIDRWLRSGSGFGNRDPGIGTRDSGQHEAGSPSGINRDGAQGRQDANARGEGAAIGPGVVGSSGWPGRRDAGATGAASSAPRDRGSGSVPTDPPPVMRGDSATVSDEGAASRAPTLLWKLAALTTVSFAVVIVLLALRRSASPLLMRWSQVTHDGHAKEIELPLLTDGPRLYFEQSINNHRLVASVSASGGEGSVVSAPGNLELSSLSPDGSRLLLFGQLPGENKARLWTSPVEGGPTDSLNGLVGGQGVWSPDGSRLLFARGNALYIAAADGDGARKLVDTGDGPQWIRWSPDGRVLRFTVQEPRAQLESIWQVSADGRNLHQFLPDWSKSKRVCCGNWTPDGRYFVFQMTVNGRTDIWAVPENRSFFTPESDKPIQITAGPMNYYSPLPSRDGKRLFVVGERPRAELMQLDMSSHHFIEFLSGISATDVSFSRDSKWVAYVSYPEYQLWRSRADGSAAQQLTFGKMTVDDPEWSPDGTQIAFLGVTDGPRYKAYAIPADGGMVQPFIPGSSEEGVPSWSPDGESIVFGELLHRKPNSQMAIHLLNLRTHQLTTLPGSQGLWSARWSPDGKYIAAVSSDQERNFPSLWLYSVETRKWTLMAKASGINEPAWASLSDYIYFATPLDAADPALYRVRVRDHKRERLASLRPNPEGEMWTGVTPDGSPLILRNAASQEIYSLEWKLGQ